MRCTVNHDYRAYRDGRQLGPWEKGAEIEIDAPDAEWVNRDSPGALTEVKPKTAGKATK